VSFFTAKTPDGLPELVVCLLVIGIHFMSEILPRLQLDFFTVSAAGFRASVYRECKEESALL